LEKCVARVLVRAALRESLERPSLSPHGHLRRPRPASALNSALEVEEYMTRAKIAAFSIAFSLLIALVLFTAPTFIDRLRESREPALLEAHWGMTPKRVSQTLGFALSDSKAEPFFSAFKIFFPTVNKSRFRNFGLVSDDFRLWTYDTSVYFTFFDNQLYQYMAEIEWEKPTELHKTIMDHLIGKYGRPSKTEQYQKEMFIHDSEWMMPHVRIEYWLTQDTTAEVPDKTRYTARVRATYLPLEQAIQIVAKKEQKNIF
jgi:hypothetical protein